MAFVRVYALIEVDDAWESTTWAGNLAAGVSRAISSDISLSNAEIQRISVEKFAKRPGDVLTGVRV